MKSIGLALLALILSITLVHSGRTDVNGGHWDHSTGEYHYHHGYPAHQHPNGVCPYNYDDATNHSSPSGQNRTIATSTKEPSAISVFFARALLIFLLSLLIPQVREFVFVLMYLLWLKIRDLFVFMITKIRRK